MTKWLYQTKNAHSAIRQQSPKAFRPRDPFSILGFAFFEVMKNVAHISAVVHHARKIKTFPICETPSAFHAYKLENTAVCQVILTSHLARLSRMVHLLELGPCQLICIWTEVLASHGSMRHPLDHGDHVSIWCTFPVPPKANGLGGYTKSNG